MGLLKPRLTADGGVHGRFFGDAYLDAGHLLDRLQAAGHAVWVARGVFSVARDADEQAVMERLAVTLPVGQAQVLGPAAAGELSGVHTPFGGLWFPGGGTLRPPVVCAALADGVQIIHATVSRLEAAGDGWRVLSADGHCLTKVDGVVYAVGEGLTAAVPQADFPLVRNRGQITVLAARGTEGIPHGLSFGGYVTAASALTQDGPEARVIGATYDRLRPDDHEEWRRPRSGDDDRNRALISSFLPDLDACLSRDVMQARTGVRAVFADHMPVVGPLFEASVFAAAYTDLHHGRRMESYPPAPWQRGVYVLGGLGSRGFQSASLLARILVAIISGQPAPVAADILAAVHPARFLVRRLRRAPRR